MSKYLAVFSVLTVLVFGFGLHAFAQEMNTTTTQESADETSTTSEEMVEEPTVEEELTEEEIQTILDEEEVLTEEDIQGLEDLEGEVIATTDEEVIIEQPSGEIIVVDAQTYEKVTSGKRSGSRKISKGQKVESGTVTTSGGVSTVTTQSGTYPITGNTQITKGGKTASIADLKDGDRITAFIDSDGNLLALELASQLEKASNVVVIGTVLAILAVLALFAFSRKKGKVTVS